MKLVTMQELVDMPKGTVFTKYPLGCHELLIKDNTVPGLYFLEQRLSDSIGDSDGELFDPDCEVKTHQDFPIELQLPDVDDTHTAKSMFIVYSHNDVEALINRLAVALGDSKSLTIEKGE